MAVPEQIPVVNYVADGIVKKFDVPFEYDQQSDLHVYVDGVEPTIDKYFFADNSFNFYIAPTIGQDVKIKRITPKERDTDYNLHTNTVRPKALNTDFDRLWYVLQEVFSDVGGLSQTVQDEIIARIQGDEDLLNQLTAEISARMLGDEAVTEDLKNYINNMIALIIGDPSFNGIDADKVNDASRETQQQVNYNGGSKWHSRVGGYKLNERVVLTNGEIVKSTIDGNTNDPNTDMMGWVNPEAEQRAKNLDSFSFDDVLSQNEISNSGTTDLSVKLQSVFNDLSIKKITFKRPYYINQLVNLSRDIEMEWVGDGEFIYGASGKVDAAGSATLIGKLQANATKYTRTVSVPAGISSGDIICIYNPADFSFSSHRDYYREGQFATVASVSGGVATLYDTLYADYDTTCDVYKIDRKKITLKNPKFSVNAPSNSIPFLIRYAKVGIYGLDSNGSERYGLVLNRCYGGNVVAVDAKQFKAVPDGYQYGVGLFNCQDVYVSGGYAAASRHGVTFGSLGGECAIPNRNVTISNMTITSTSNDFGGADIHGNSDNVKYINCTIHHAAVGGKNISILDSTIYGRGLDGLGVWMGEIIGGVFEVKRCKIFSNGPSESVGYIYAILNKDIRENVFFDIADVAISAPNASSLSQVFVGVVTNNLQLTKKVNVSVDGVKGFDLPALRSVSRFQFGSSGSTTKIPINTFKINNIEGLPTCSMVFTTSDWDVGYSLKLMRQSGSQVVDTENGAKTLVVGATAYFKYTYPTTPKLSMSVSTTDNTWNSAFSTVPISPAASLRGNYIIPAIQAPSAMPASKSITVGWEVGI